MEDLVFLRPKLSVGVKTLTALSLVFWIPVIALTTALYFSFNKSLLTEGLDTVKTNLKGADVLFQERARNLKSVMDHVTGQQDLKEMFKKRDSRGLQEFLLELGKNNTHAEILIAVNENQKVLGRKNGKTGDIIILGDALSRALLTGETIITTELVTREFLSQEDESLASRAKDVGIAQFVISPIRSGDKIRGAVIAGILLSGESWLGNSIHHKFGVEMGLFAGETFESFYLHSTTSLPHATWMMGQAIPRRLKEEISLGKPFYGVLEIEKKGHITAFEPLKDSRNRVIGAIGVTKESKNITRIVVATIGKVLLVVASLSFIFAILITIVIYRDITRPLNTLVRVMKRFESGEMDIAVNVKTGDEFEKLGTCFNSMAESARRREIRLKKHYQVARLLMSTIDLKELADKILNVVTDVTESQLCILYLCNETEQNLVPSVQYGCRADLYDLKVNEGFPGRALIDRKCIMVKRPDTEREEVLEMGFTEMSLEEIAYIPLIYKNINLGVLVIGRLKGYSDDEKELFNYLGNQISIALDNTILHRKIQELSISDHLTGLYNRRYLSMRLEEEWARCLRQKEPLSILLADMDDFKIVNDTYGHDKGDEVLKNVGTILRKMSRKEDVVARYGGEEFVAVLSNINSAEAALKADEIRKAIKDCVYPWAEAGITVSIGVATFPEIRVENAEVLLQTADNAMYKAKTGGKNRVVVCT